MPLPWSRPALLLLLLGTACAPASAPAPAPAPVPPSAPAPLPAPDPEPSLPWHLLDPDTDGTPGAAVERALRHLEGRPAGRTVVVAVIDGGVDTAHVDLRDRLWINEGEVPANGGDDDANGYVDDRHGWNFLGGASGASVHQDTWEVTRLYVGCTGQGAALAVESPRAPCDEVLAEYAERRAEAEELLGTVQGLGGALDQVLPILREASGADSLTVESVTALQSTTPRVQQARAFYLQLAANGIEPRDVYEALDALEEQVEYNLNPDFDPRPVVGDDYDDGSEVGYGNADVMGPDASHGTHVAGIIGALRGNGGAEGVAPEVRIMAIRAVPNGDEHDKDVANAIRYAVDNGAHIINMSFGKSWSPQKELVDAAVRYADERGVLMIHAAGNDGEDLEVTPSYPSRDYLDGGRAELWIEVGATRAGPADSLAAPFSNYGASRVDLFAPGVDILSTYPGGGTREQQGTSMAAPVVSGVAALLMSRFPELTAAEIRDILLETATPFGESVVARPGGGDPVPFGTLSSTGGVVNAYRAVLRAEERIRSR